MIVIGAKEPNGGPAEISGIDRTEVDGLVLWLESVARAWVSPHIVDLRIIPIETPSGSLLAISIPTSFDRPHEVPRAGSRFFVRDERSIRELSREELRNLIRNDIDFDQAVTASVEEEWKSFAYNPFPRSSQLAAAQGGAMVRITPAGQRFRVPMSAILAAAPYATSMARETARGTPRIDGVEFQSRQIDDRFSGSIKIGKAANVEIFDGYVFDFVDDRPLPGKEIMEQLVVSTIWGAGIVSKLSAAPTARVDLRVKTLSGKSIAFFREPWHARTSVDRDDLEFDPLYIDLTEKCTPKSLRSLLDQFWQAFGFEGCGYFSDQDEWRLPA